jgi:23S rRNA (adenine2503-C2)-methyltransferase
LSPTANFFDLNLPELSALLQAWNEPAYRARQIWHNVYVNFMLDPMDMTNLPLELRHRLVESLRFSTMDMQAITNSTDGQTQKMLMSLIDGEAVEVVLMRYHRRCTACISTQVGCAMGCVFCETGQMGFVRNLTAGEIVEQVMFIAHRLHDGGERLTNIVVMGMGEPFHNYEALMQAIDRLNDSEGFRFGARRITISTIGIIPMIEKFTQERRQINLAVSLHAATNALRDTLLPVNRRYPLEPLLSACRAYVAHTGRRITFEWALIRDTNDTPDQANALVSLLAGLNCHVNLIPLNPTANYLTEPSPTDRVQAFANVLTSNGIACSTRIRRGVEIHAGCGQLATRSKV